MLCALLKHIQTMAEYCICCPKLAKRLRRMLVKSWSEGESHVQVMAFMVLRRITLLQPHPALHQLLKVYCLTPIFCVMVVIDGARGRKGRAFWTSTLHSCTHTHISLYADPVGKQSLSWHVTFVLWRV